MDSYLHQISFAAFLLLGLAQAVVLFADPKDQRVEVNQWAQFNCTAHCNYTVSWYMAGHSRAIKTNNTVPGLLIKRRRSSTCTESGERCTSDRKMHFFEVHATGALNASVFYCAAYETHRSQCRCASGRCYSKPALLTVIRAAAVTPPSQTSAGMTEVTSSPCPSPTHTLRNMDMETVSPELITMTTTVTVTVTPTPTKSPNADLTLSAHMQSSGTPTTSMKAAILASLGIAAFILLL